MKNSITPSRIQYVPNDPETLRLFVDEMIDAAFAIPREEMDELHAAADQGDAAVIHALRCVFGELVPSLMVRAMAATRKLCELSLESLDPKTEPTLLNWEDSISMAECCESIIVCAQHMSATYYPEVRADIARAKEEIYPIIDAIRAAKKPKAKG